MTDIKKTIEHLKELEAGASPGPWFSLVTDMYTSIDSNQGRLADLQYPNDAALIVAMRNALPELLQELERLEVRAERAEKDFHALNNDALAIESARIKIEAERGFLLNCLSSRVDCFGINCPIKEPMPDCAVAVDADASREDCLKCLKDWAERKATISTDKDYL